MRARLNTRIEADGQTLANRDTVRIEGLASAGPGHLAVVSRQTGPGEWSKRFFVPVAYLEQSAELAYAGNVHVAQGRTVDRGHLVVDGGANRSLVYTGATRGREKNTIHVSTGAPDPAQPSRAEREAFTDAAIRQRAELRRQGDAEAARAVPLSMPDRPSDRQLAPWEAELARALQQDEPERTALEEMQAAQDYATHTGHLLELSEAYWRLDVVPQIDEMVRQRVSPREYERYRQDPERPALLQALRAHEIGGRRIEDSLDAITAEPMTGLRSIAAGLHGRLGKEPPPARGETRTWAERAPQDAPGPVREAARMLDARQAELGRQLAERPPLWAISAWGVPPSEAESAARRADWEKQAGIVGTYREAAGITDLAHALGPVPSGQAQLRETFHAAVVALQLPDDQALLRSMGRGDLEAIVAAYDRAAAAAPRDVQAEISEREHAWEDAQVRGHIAGYDMDAEAAAGAEAEGSDAAEDLTGLAVADAARREWAEAHAEDAEAARAAEAELRRRAQAERIPAPPGADHWPMTDAEFSAYLEQLVAATEAQPDAGPGREAEAERTAAAEPAGEAEARQDWLMPTAEFGQYLDRLVAEAEGREWAPPAMEPEADPEPQPGPSSEAELQEQLGRIVAESEGREYVPPAPGPEAEGEPRPVPMGEAEFQEQLGRIVAGSEGREYVPPEPEPESEPQPEPLSDAEFWAQLNQIVRDSQRGPEPAPEPDVYAEIHEDLAAIGDGIRELADRMEAEDTRRAEAQAEAMNEPARWKQAQIQAQAEAAAEASWQPGNAPTEAGQTEADVDLEAEI